MATWTKYNNFVQDLGRKVHNLNADVLKVALTNTTPNAGTNTVLVDAVEIAAGNGYSAGGSVIASTAWAQTSGTAKLAGLDVVFTASGGSIGPFRYAVVYNDTPTSPADPLISYFDYGASITITSGNTFTVDFSDNTQLATLA
jgi:hypothetical protein